MSDGDESRRPGWVAWLPLIAIILVFAAWGLTHLGGTYWDTDEGLNLTKARMLQLGYGLYSEIWADQPPGLTSLLAGAFAVFGPTVQVARAVVLAHALVGLVAVAWIAREAGGGVLGAIAAAALLAISPNFAWASRAVMIGLPALSLATLAIALSLTYSRTRNRTWLAACGLALGLGLTEKLIGAYLLVPIALAVVLPSSRDTCSPDDSERDNSSRGGSSWADFSVRRALADLAIVAVFAALPAAVALVAFDARAMTDQVIGVVLRARDAYAYELAWSVDKLGEYLLGDHLLIVGPALYGALWSLRQRSIAASVLLSWLALTIAVLLTQSPLWPKHHFLALLIALAPLAGLGVAEAWRAATAMIARARGAVPETPGDGVDDASGAGAQPFGWGSALWAAVGVVALLAMAIGLPPAMEADAVRAAAAPYKASGKLPKSEAYLHMDEAVAMLRDATEPDDFVITDQGMIAFQSGRRVPPELCVISGKRIAVGDLTVDDLLASEERYQPAAVLLWEGDRLSRDELAPYGDHVRATFDLAGRIGDLYELYVPRDGPAAGAPPSTGSQ